MVFFSFAALDGAGLDDHRRYNEWHQLDHRPENLALPGVAWGDRRARTESGSVAVAEYESVLFESEVTTNVPGEDW
jgi:hypothetical protein